MTMLRITDISNFLIMNKGNKVEKKNKYEQLRHASGGFQKSQWLEEAEQRKANKSWLKHSQKIALLVLRHLRENKISQKELAERLSISPQQVNKWLKGNENFTLDTICKLEEALDIQLLTIGEARKPIGTLHPVYTKKEEYKLPQVHSRNPNEERVIHLKTFHQTAKYVS